MNIDSINIEQAITRLHDGLQALLQQTGRTRPVLVGIRTGGVWVAERLHERLGTEEPLGKLNIAFYRDDFSRIGLHPKVTPSELPFAIEDRDVILVDDVLHTGRTIRAAMNELFDYGRPASICLAVLIDRSGHELPIQADVVGEKLELAPDEHAKLCGPEPLVLELTKTA
ncbi:MAG: bifunctional pyr operon transcriptional regulator/uracil phosphoribosyltransferase PyrR [Gammaproteobacteria bacterium]